MKKKSYSPIKRPLVVLLLFCAPGILTGIYAHPLRLPFLSAGFIFTLGAVSTFLFPAIGNVKSRPWIRGVCVCGAAFFLSAGYTAMRDFYALQNDILMEKPREGLEIKGVVLDQPVIYKRNERGISLRFSMRPAAVRRVLDWEPVNDLVWVTLNADGNFTGAFPEYGDKWICAGVLRDNARDIVSGEILPPARRTGPRYSFFCGINEAQRISSGHGSVFKRFILRTREKCSDILALGIEDQPEAKGVLRAILLGYREELPADTADKLSRTGTFHIMAISGLHVGIVAALLAGFLRLAGVSRHRWFFVLGPVVIFYVMLTGMRPSAVRAGLMAVIFFAGLSLGRKPDALSSLACAALILLAFDPFGILDAGFLFSFIVVAALLLFYLPVAKTVDLWIKHDEICGPARRCFNTAATFFTGLVFVSSTAWIAAAPLTAFFFSHVTPVGLIVNPVVVPLVFLVVFLGLVSLPAGCAHPLLATVLNRVSARLISVITGITGVAADIPMGCFNVRQPPLWVIGAWYLCLIGLATLPKKRFAIAGFMILALWSGMNARYGAEYIDVLPAGNTGAVFIRAAGMNILVDTGPPYHSRKITRHLGKQGVNKIDGLIAVRGDYAAIGGYERIMGNFSIGEFIRPAGFTGQSRGYQATEFAKDQNIPVRITAHNDSPFPDIGMEFIACEKPGRASGHPVVLINYSSTRILLAGRAGNECLANLANRLADDPVDFIISYNRKTAELFGTTGETRKTPFVIVCNDKAIPDFTRKSNHKECIIIQSRHDEFVRLILHRKKHAETRIIRPN